ncbi:MAG: hypothetical protein WCP15_04040 [bacterium]
MFGVLFNTLAENFTHFVIPRVFDLIVFLAPFAIPALLLEVFWEKWVDFIRLRFIYSQDYVLLEIKVPKDNVKSPAAMEVALLAAHQGFGESNWYQRFWLGSIRPWFSLEIVSVEGQVKFMIWTRKAMKRNIESALYSQFPNIEVHEVPDYTHSVTFDPKRDKMWAVEFCLAKEDPYPIKTYIDYGLEKDPKEEFKIDPITPGIEGMGSVGANQQVWIQILVRSHKGDSIKKGTFFKNTDPLIDSYKKIINEIKNRDPETRTPIKVEGSDDMGFRGLVSLTKGEEEVIASIERAMQKAQFDVVIRGINYSPKENFDGGNNGVIIGMWKQYASEHLNAFKPNIKKYSMIFNYPWQDFMNFRNNAQMKNALDAYKKRAVFYSHGLHSKPFVLNSEELATIFHFPGGVSQTPTYERILSKKGEPPANLPI